MVSATVLGIESDIIKSEVLNVGADKPIDVMNVARILLNKYDCKIEPVVTGNYRLGDIRHNYADLTKIKRILGFVPQYSFNAGVNKFVEWVNRQSIKDDKFSESIKEMKDKGLFK